MLWGPTYDLSWRMFHAHLGKMCFLVLLDGMLFMCAMSFRSIVLFRFTVSVLIFCLEDLSNVSSEVLKSPKLLLYCCLFIILLPPGLKNFCMWWGIFLLLLSKLSLGLDGWHFDYKCFSEQVSLGWSWLGSFELPSPGCPYPFHKCLAAISSTKLSAPFFLLLLGLPWWKG